MRVNPYNNLQYQYKIKSSVEPKENFDKKRSFCAFDDLNFVSKLNIYNLSSKFNINFTSSKLDKFCEEYENRIKKNFSIDEKNLKINSQIKTSSDIHWIEEAFLKDEITDIFPTGVSLNNAVRYLYLKDQINLDFKRQRKLAFLVDDLSVKYLENLKKHPCKKFDSLLRYLESKNLIFYFIDTNDKKREELTNRIKKAVESEIEIKTINTKKNKRFNCYPSKDDLKKLIEEYLAYKSENGLENTKEFLPRLLKYLDDTSLFLSYRDICLELRNIYDKIENEVRAEKKSMDDVVYIYPFEDKSYDLINYLFAKENNIACDKFMSFDDVSKMLSSQDGAKRTFVVLDDLSLSGFSMCNDIILYFLHYIYNHNKGNDLIVSPIVYTDLAKEQIQKCIKNAHAKSNAKIKFIENIKYNSISNANEAQFAKLSKDDIDSLLKELKGGYGEQYASIFLPYMIPDNSSDIATLLGGGIF